MNKVKLGPTKSRNTKMIYKNKIVHLFTRQQHLWVVAVLLVLLASCESKEICADEVSTMKAKVVSISGSDNLEAGGQTSLTIGVANNAKYCVQQADANITPIGKDTFIVGANILYSELKTSAACDCKTDSTLYTLLYFTPLTPGLYYFITEGDTTISLGNNANTAYMMEVH